jgi:hypothetical protein
MEGLSRNYDTIILQGFKERSFGTEKKGLFAEADVRREVLEKETDANTTLN